MHGRGRKNMMVTNLSDVTLSSLINCSPIFTFRGDNSDIVSVNRDGSITWHTDIDINSAAEAFSKVLRIGTEIAAGIKAGVRKEIRNEIFQELIEISKDKEITTEELTFLLNSKIIIEKLTDE